MSRPRSPRSGTLLAGGPYSDADIVPVSGLDGAGIDALRATLDRAAAGLPGRAEAPGPARLHIDRSFTLRGIGTVVTGTLWAGELSTGERVRVEPGGAEYRIRSVQVHGAEVQRAAAGQRVAVALTGADRRAVNRGDVLTRPGGGIRATHRIAVSLNAGPLDNGARVQLHHGTRQTAHVSGTAKAERSCSSSSSWSRSQATGSSSGASRRPTRSGVGWC